MPNKIKAKHEVKKEAKMDVPNKIKVEKEVRKEAKMDDDDDHIPISQRVKKSVSLDNRSLSKKPTKVVTSQLKKTNKKSKKIIKASKYSKSLKVPPGSGGGQKWTTLEHNGVIFPPPYKPRWIKMILDYHPRMNSQGEPNWMMLSTQALQQKFNLNHTLEMGGYIVVVAYNYH